MGAVCTVALSKWAVLSHSFVWLFLRLDACDVSFGAGFCLCATDFAPQLLRKVSCTLYDFVKTHAMTSKQCRPEYPAGNEFYGELIPSSLSWILSPPADARLLPECGGLGPGMLVRTGRRNSRLRIGYHADRRCAHTKPLRNGRSGHWVRGRRDQPNGSRAVGV